MSEKKIENTELTNIEGEVAQDIDEQAKLAAASEHIEEKEPELEYTVKFNPPHIYEGEEYTELDLSKVRELSTKDAELLDRTMQLMKHYPGGNKFNDSTYMKHMAIMVTGKPIEFFNTMSMRNFEEVKGRLMMYFLFE